MIRTNPNPDHLRSKVLSRLRTTRPMRGVMSRKKPTGTIQKRWSDNGAILPEKAYQIKSLREEIDNTLMLSYPPKVKHITSSAPMVNNANSLSPTSRSNRYAARNKSAPVIAGQRPLHLNAAAKQNAEFYKPGLHERPYMQEAEADRRKRRVSTRIKRGLLGAATLLGAARLKHMEDNKKIMPGVSAIGAVLASSYGVPALRDAFGE